ncbi:MAG: hypothetical protein Q7S09_02910 [bacterium]|nr:hypothetical protein [bacterium]
MVEFDPPFDKEGSNREAPREYNDIIPSQKTPETSASDAEAYATWRARIENSFALADASLDYAESLLREHNPEGYRITREAAENSLGELSDELKRQGLTTDPGAKELIAWWMEREGQRAERIEEMDERAKRESRELSDKEQGIADSTENVPAEEASFENEEGGQSRSIASEARPASANQEGVTAEVEKAAEEVGKIIVSGKELTPGQVTKVEQTVEVLEASSPEVKRLAEAAKKEIKAVQKDPSRWERMRNWLKSKDETFKKDVKAEGGIGAVVKKGKLGKLFEYGFMVLLFAISNLLSKRIEKIDKKRH